MFIKGNKEIKNELKFVQNELENTKIENKKEINLIKNENFQLKERLGKKIYY